MTRRIVVIDADQPIRALVSEWLTDAGYAVLAQPAPAPVAEVVHLVVLDLVNLRHSGRQTVDDVRRLFDAVPIVGLSTQVNTSLPGHAQAAYRLGLDLLLAKPCGRDEMLGSLRALLKTA